MGSQDIYNYRKVTDSLITAGQPTEEQLTSVANEGFRVVVNLATLDPRYSLADEAGLAERLGMAYYHIPVEWDNPQESDFQAFESLMGQVGNTKTLVHCAANFRVSAFYSLYALKHLGWSETEAEQFRASIWQGSNIPVWEAFIAGMKAKIAY